MAMALLGSFASICVAWAGNMGWHVLSKLGVKTKFTTRRSISDHDLSAVLQDVVAKLERKTHHELTSLVENLSFSDRFLVCEFLSLASLGMLKQQTPTKGLPKRLRMGKTLASGLGEHHHHESNGHDPPKMAQIESSNVTPESSNVPQILQPMIVSQIPQPMAFLEALPQEDEEAPSSLVDLPQEDGEAPSSVVHVTS